MKPDIPYIMYAMNFTWTPIYNKHSVKRLLIPIEAGKANIISSIFRLSFLIRANRVRPGK